MILKSHAVTFFTGEWMCGLCKSTVDNKDESFITSPNKSPFRTPHLSPGRPLTLKGPFTKSPPKTKQSSNTSSPQTKRTTPEKRQLFGSTDQIVDGDDFTGIWEFKDETSEAGQKLKRSERGECSSSPKKKSVKLEESKSQEEQSKTTPKPEKGKMSYSRAQ
jgi:hypothetical protein